MKSDFEAKFYDTFYELFIYSLFDSLGFNIQIHPDLPHTSRKPDFLATNDSMRIYIEAKISRSLTREDEAFENMKNSFYDSINKFRFEGYMLGIEEIEFISKKQPSTKRILKFLDSEFRKLEKGNYSKNRLVNIRITYSDEDILIVFNPIQVEKTNDLEYDKRPIGIFPFEFVGRGDIEIKKALQVKAKRYGKMDKPFIICLNALGKNVTSRADIDDAIWGSLALQYSEDPNDDSTRWVRLRDGMFIDAKGVKNTNVTGILITQISPTNIDNTRYYFYINPFANFKIPHEILGLKYNSVENNIIQIVEGDDLSNILED